MNRVLWLLEAYEQRGECGERTLRPPRFPTDPSDEDGALAAALAWCRWEIDTARNRLAVLLAYAREHQGARPYPLTWLAQAAGMSTSGARTAYTAEHVSEAAELISPPAGEEAEGRP
jgi:hypothetical protein